MKCKYKHYNKKCETCGIKLKDCECFLDYIKFKDNLIKYKCLCCNKHHQKNLMRTWRKDSLMHTIFQPMISISLFYCCEKAFALIIIWMIWIIFNKTLLPEKVDIHSHLKMEHITYVDNMHRKWVCKDSKIKKYIKISWFVCSKQSIIVRRCIWKLSEYVSWNTWTWPCSFPNGSKISMTNSLKKD